MNVVQEQTHGIFGGEHELARQQPIADAANRVDVHSTIEGSSAQRLFRRDECRRTVDYILPGQRRSCLARLAEGSHQPKIQYLDEVAVLAVAANKNVRRFDVPMHQAAGLRLRRE